MSASKNILPAAILMVLCVGAQAGRFLKNSEDFEYNHQELFNHTDFLSLLKNYTSTHNYTLDKHTIEIPEHFLVSIYNHTWNKTHASYEEFLSYLNHTTKTEAKTYNFSDIYTALFNYSKTHHATVAAKKDEVKYELPDFHYELPKYNHTMANLTFVLPTYNHSDHKNLTGVVAEVAGEYEAFVEKHG